MSEDINKEEVENKENFQDENTQNIDNNSEEISENEKEETCEELLLQEKDKFLRLFAEFENYKKRTAKERIELISTANQSLMTSILPVLDDFERGISEIKKAKDSELLKGMELIKNKFANILKGKGLEEIKVKKGDTFNVEIHEAITQIPAPNKKMVGKLIDVVETGYKLGDKIIRYPKVIVGK